MNEEQSPISPPEGNQPDINIPPEVKEQLETRLAQVKRDLIAMINQIDINMLLEPHSSLRIPRSNDAPGFNVNSLLDTMNKPDDTAGQQKK